MPSRNFVYHFSTDKLHDLNLLYTSLFPNDHLTVYSVVQHDRTKLLYLSLRTHRNKFYLCLLKAITHDNDNAFVFRFRRSVATVSRIRNIQFWNLIRYETYSPYPSCRLSENAKSISDFMSCESFDEEAFLADMKTRGELAGFLFKYLIK
jgi:hypothetical protein